MSTSSPLFAYLRNAVPMWVGTIFVVAGSLAAYGAFGEWREALRFEREAVTAPAEVLGTSIERASRDGNPRTRYLVTYRFAPSGGPPVELAEEIPVEEWEELAPGHALEVRYLRNDPGGARTTPASASWTQLLVVGLTTLLAIVGVRIALPWWRRALVLLRVQRSGVTAQATVLEVVETGLRVNRVPQWQITYEYRDERGTVHQSKSDYLPPGEALQWQRGARATVRFDRDRPSDSIWLGRT